MRRHPEFEAIEVLRETLRQISVIKVKEIVQENRGNRKERMILGQIEIYGHPHLLACAVLPGCETIRVKRELSKLHGMQMERGSAIPVLIAPAISEEVQNLCRESGVGFLDLHGNAHLYLDEVFIVKRSFPYHPKLPPAAETLPKSETAHFARVA